MTTGDHELDLWKREWQTEAAGTFPKLRRTIRLQTARMIASNVIGLGIGGAALMYVARIVLRHPTPQTIVWGGAVLLCSVATGLFTVWNQIGIWRAETESTRAYAELSYKRALTKVRRTRFVSLLLCGCAVFDVGYLVWADWSQIVSRPIMLVADLARISAVLLPLWLFITWYGRRKDRQAEQARRFIEALDR